MATSNLFKPNTPNKSSGQEESFETLLQRKNVTIEHIQSPAGTRSQMFNQQQDEWVCLLQGEAELELNGEIIRLKKGESCFIPAGSPHRVTDTSDHPTCIWLAVHIY